MKTQNSEDKGVEKLGDNNGVICYSCSGLSIFTSEMKQAGKRPLCIGISKKLGYSEVSSEYYPTDGNQGSKLSDDCNNQVEDFYFACAGYTQMAVHSKRGTPTGMPVCDFGLNFQMAGSPSGEEEASQDDSKAGQPFPAPHPLLYAQDQEGGRSSSKVQRHRIGTGERTSSNDEDRESAPDSQSNNISRPTKPNNQWKTPNKNSNEDGDGASKGFGDRMSPLIVDGIGKWTNAMNKNLTFMTSFSAGMFDNFGDRYIASSHRIITQMGRQSSHLYYSSRRFLSRVLPFEKDADDQKK
mmetsp:Transcript_4316/g.5955  ORF Transcript_4316/g.5955 Transcript_4316/m.5955 type:complete len:297 (+) Transcript_4316:108-998(+)